MEWLETAKQHAPGVFFLYAYSVVIALAEFATLPREIFAIIVSIPSLCVIGISLTVTTFLVKRLYEPVAAVSYFDALDIAVDDESPLKEVADDDVLDLIPHDMGEVQSVQRTNSELFDEVDGNQYDSTDQDIRGTVTTLLSCVVIGVSAPIIAFLNYGRIWTALSVVLGMVCLALALHYYMELRRIIEHSSTRLQHEN